MQNLIKRLKSSPRFWTAFASFSVRGAGFFIALFLSRIYGASTLGSYSALVNTASAVATPFSLVLSNNSTLFGTEGFRRNDDGNRYAMLGRASFFIALLVSLISIGILIAAYFALVNEKPIFMLMLLVAGACVIIGEIFGAVSQGFLYGAGHYIYPARTTLFVTIAVCLAVYPLIKMGGLGGALALLIATSILPPLVMAKKVLAEGRETLRFIRTDNDAWDTVRSGLFRGTPTFVTTVINNVSYWICSIYLVQSTFGSTGVGIVAVAGQWLNLMLIPATSWGGLSLRTLADLVLGKDRIGVRRASKDLVMKNVLTTFALAGTIALFSEAIAWAYNLKGSGLALLIYINAACALIKSINIVLERLLFALGYQRWWAILSFLSCVGQVILTFILLSNGLWAVPFAAVMAGSALCFLSLIGLRLASNRTVLSH